MYIQSIIIMLCIKHWILIYWFGRVYSKWPKKHDPENVYLVKRVRKRSTLESTYIRKIINTKYHIII